MSAGHAEWVLEPTEATLRTVFGYFATGVTIITALDDGEPVGMAVNSFASVSLDPPLALFCAATSSSTWPRIERAGHWAANIVAEDGEELTRTFATRGAERFNGVGWKSGASGAPVLDDALAYVDCETEALHAAGDHVIVVGRVRRLGHRVDGGPLLFYRGGYGRYRV